jgi:signal transduction histidine kinase
MIIITLVLVVFILFVFDSDNETNLNVVEVNDITESIRSSWGNINETNLPGLQYEIDYVILDEFDYLVARTKVGLNEDIFSAVKNRDTIIYITEEKEVIGKIIFYNDTLSSVVNYRSNLQVCSIIVLALIFTVNILNLIFIDNSIFKPFRRLKNFSEQIAQGNLDIPLDMDKNNMFGSFTESFDIMRSELNIAKHNEHLANQSKKELVATLSHDINTPVASIKAVSEVMIAKIKDPELIRQLEVINLKAEQISNLITNIFNATLEELKELKVTVSEEASNIVEEIIKRADYNNLCSNHKISECLIVVDALRLEQVIDNIISNSYKYANTSISITSSIVAGYLEIEFRDFGNGVKEDEVLLLANKYYRGENAETKSGTGLGLYISKFLVNKMNGEISFSNSIDGFSVKLQLLIV